MEGLDTMTPEQLREMVGRLTSDLTSSRAKAEELEKEKNLLKINNGKLLNEKTNVNAKSVPLDQVLELFQKGKVPEQVEQKAQGNPDQSALFQQLLKYHKKAADADALRPQLETLQAESNAKEEQLKAAQSEAAKIGDLTKQIDDLTKSRDTLQARVNETTMKELFVKESGGRFRPEATPFLLSSAALGPFISLDEGKLKVHDPQGNELKTAQGKTATLSDLVDDTGPNGDGSLTGGLKLGYLLQEQNSQQSDLSESTGNKPADDGYTDEDREVMNS